MCARTRAAIRCETTWKEILKNAEEWMKFNWKVRNAGVRTVRIDLYVVE